MDPFPPGGPSGAGRRRALGVVFLLGMAGVAACTDDPDPRPATATVATAEPSSSTTTTVEEVDVEAEVKAAAIDAGSAYYEALLRLDPDHEDMVATRSGPALDFARERFRDFEDSGIRIRYGPQGPPRLVVRSVEVNSAGTGALVESCVLDDAVQVDAGTGEVLNDDVVAKSERLELELIDGRWKLTGGELVQRAPGGTCA